MPGTPDPVLGSTALTVAVAVSFAAVTVGAVVWSRNRSTRTAAGVTGVVAAGFVAVWLVVRVVAWVPPWEYLSPPSAAATAALVGFVAIAACVVVPAATLRRGLVAPLAPLAGATGLLAFALLRVGGESDPLVIYAVVVSPVVLGVEILIVVAEAVVRRLWRAVNAE
ncbi:hypothetical protein [Halobaculum sp. MBLA0143]|uniref:hypothetical protein n=1 Tax=Halobaculum sp. MBLA0143 TaxID=3079933 RepID=UPI0035238DD7